MSASVPRLAVTVSVRGPLAHHVRPGPGADRTAGQVGGQLDRMLDYLGLPGRTDVRVEEPGDMDTPAPEDWIELRVLGERCRYPAELLAQLAAAFDGRQAEHVDPPLPEDWPQATSDSEAGERAAVLIGALCAEAVALRPSVLLGPGTLAAYAEALGPHVAGCSPEFTSPDWLAGVLTALLDHGIGAGDVPAVARVLQEGQRTGQQAVSELLISALSAPFVDVLVPEDIAPLLGHGDVEDPEDLLGFTAVSLFEENGMLVPPFRLRPPDGIPAGCFAFRVNSLLTAPFPVLAADEILVNDLPERLLPMSAWSRPAVNPGSGRPGALAPAAESPRLEAAGLTVWSRSGHIVLCLAQELRRRAGRLIHQDKLQAQLDVLEEFLPSLVGAARARTDAGQLTALLRALAADGIPLRDLPPVLERVIDATYAPTGPALFALLDDPVTSARATPAVAPGSPVWLETFVRTGLRREIAARLSANQDTLVVYLLDAEIERLLREEPCEDTDSLMVAAVRAELAELPATATLPVILTDDDVRPLLRSSLARVLPRVGVVGYGDLPPDLNIQPVSRIVLLPADPPPAGRPPR